MGGIGSIQAYDPALLVDQPLRSVIDRHSNHLEVGDKADVRLLSWGDIFSPKPPMKMSLRFVISEELKVSNRSPLPFGML